MINYIEEKMTLLKNDPLTQLAFSIHENKGVFAILLGSGLSRSAEIPTGWEITIDLVRRVALAQGEKEQSDWAKWYRETTGTEPNYSSLLEDIAISPDERRSILHSYIEPNEEDRAEGKKTPTQAHRAIAKLVSTGHIRVIITTNFDRLMENALRDEGIEPTVVSTLDSLQGAEPLIHSQCYILKIHGDYKDARILNTDSELEHYPVEFNTILDRIIDEHGMIICGWSGEWDHALRAAFTRSPSRRYPMFWAARGGLGARANDLANHRQAKIISINGADDFFHTLQQRVSILEQSQRQNPLSIELLTNSTKKYLSKPEHRIQLDELIAGEVERLLENISNEKFTTQGQWSPEEFQQRVALYESATEALGRIVGVLGRWGNENDVLLVTEIIRTVMHNAQNHNGGLSVWIDLRAYPAVLIMTAYATGLTLAKRWADLHSLFLTSLPNRYDNDSSIVSSLFLWKWDGGRDTWKHLEGLERRKTALSDHLLDIMSEWKTSFSGVSANFELIFDKFETLASLAYFDDETKGMDNLQELITSGAIRENFINIPVGRVGWNSSSFRTITEELKNPKKNTAFLEQGFANNDQQILELFLKELAAESGRMSWR
ncbi:SIR2 family protein [Salmonella enterica]|nr:SIR2 family protein [Salmonella enterica]HCB5688280.1 SIR2 family protein [Salmonella enterica subsp. salamae serovar 42:r:-]HCB5746187.1 SIR2 family protein [Salmonella enterica subsp. salamae]EIS5388650.1 SIR2 family protein [Salmonella enterica]EJF6099523.1 SIR2 family protein [Salmonella enterica]